MVDGTIQVIVDNLTPTLLKASFALQTNHKDEHVKKLVQRCNKITHLDLRFSPITNDSVQSIIQHLNTSLEEFNVVYTEIDFDALLQLKSVATLKLLGCSVDHRLSRFHTRKRNLRLKLPHVTITGGDLSLQIARPQKFMDGSPEPSRLNYRRLPHVDNDWIWEIRLKLQDLFAKVEEDIEH